MNQEIEKYKIILERVDRVFATLEVEAETQEKAECLVLELLEEGRWEPGCTLPDSVKIKITELAIDASRGDWDVVT